MKKESADTFAAHGSNFGIIFSLPAFLIACSLVFAGLALSCGGLNVSEVQPQDICKCTPLEPDIADYRHAEKHVPIPPMAPIDTTIDTIYSWPQTDPGSIELGSTLDGKALAGAWARAATAKNNETQTSKAFLMDTPLKCDRYG